MQKILIYTFSYLFSFRRCSYFLLFVFFQQALETAALYDPNLAYAYASPDAIQRYVSAGLVPYSAGGIPVYPNPGAYAVQSGYEGYLVPSFPEPAPAAVAPSNFLAETEVGPFELLGEFLPSSRTVLSLISRLSSWLFGGLGTVAMGGLITTGICTFTPLCSISFAALPFALPFTLPFLTLRDTAKTLGNAIEIDADTAERVRRAADFVQAAMEKYNKLQETFNENDNNDAVAEEQTN